MGDFVALNSRTNLPTRIIQGRPHGHSKQLLWETVKTTGQENQHKEEKGITRTVEKYAKHPKRSNGKKPTKKQRRRPRKQKDGNAGRR